MTNRSPDESDRKSTGQDSEAEEDWVIAEYPENDEPVEHAVVPGSPVHETNVPAAPDTLFDSRLLERCGIVTKGLDQQLAILAQLRCMDTSARVQQLLQDTRAYNDTPAAINVASSTERIQIHQSDQKMLERILADVRIIRDGALKTKTIIAPGKRILRKGLERRETSQLAETVKKDRGWAEFNRDAQTNFYAAHEHAGMAVAPGKDRGWIMSDGTLLDHERVLEAVAAVNEFIANLHAAVTVIQEQKLKD